MGVPFKAKTKFYIDLPRNWHQRKSNMRHWEKQTPDPKSTISLTPNGYYMVQLLTTTLQGQLPSLICTHCDLWWPQVKIYFSIHKNWILFIQFIINFILPQIPIWLKKNISVLESKDKLTTHYLYKFSYASIIFLQKYPYLIYHWET